MTNKEMACANCAHLGLCKYEEEFAAAFKAVGAVSYSVVPFGPDAYGVTRLCDSKSTVVDVRCNTFQEKTPVFRSV